MKSIVLCALIGSAFASNLKKDEKIEEGDSTKYVVQSNKLSKVHYYNDKEESEADSFSNRNPRKKLEEYIEKKRITSLEKKLIEQAYGLSLEEQIKNPYKEESKDPKITIGGLNPNKISTKSPQKKARQLR